MSSHYKNLNKLDNRKGSNKRYIFIVIIFLLTIFKSYNVFAGAPNADFSVDNTAPVVDETVTFTDQSTNGPVSWDWDFGGGAVPATANTQGPHLVTYSTAGLKTVSLTVDGPDTETKNDYIQVYATYYSTGSGDPTNTNSWNTQSDGNGTTPASTNGDCLNFIIQNGHTMTTTGAWTLGQYSGIQIEDGELVENHTITIQATGSLQVDGTGTLSHNVTNLSIFGGSVTIGSGSTVSYGGSGTQQIFNTNYSNLTVTGTGIKQVNNNLIIPGTFNSGAQLDVSVNITFNGPVICNGGTMNATLGVVTYNTAATNIVAGLYNNLTKTGGGTSTLCGDVTVSNILNLDNGIIRLADADLTVSNTGAGAITGTFNTSNMIETNGGGMFVKQGTEAGLSIIYPVGSAGFYTPMDLSNGITAIPGTGSISVRAVAGSQGTGLLQKYWEVNTQNITSITDVYPLFTYDLAEADATQLNYLPWYNPGAAWENPINSTGAGVNPFGSTSTTQLAGKWTAGDKVPPTPDIYYSFQSGDWDNPDTWTFDPGGTTLTPTDIPNENDKVVILNGRTVTLTNDLDTAGLDIKIKEGATLDLATFSFSNGIGTLQGQGTVKLASVNYPTVTSNLFVLAGGGTTEYYNATDFTLPIVQTKYNHLRINAPGVVATQLSDITLNGDLHVKQGTYRINDNTAARRKLTIQGDVLVDNGASLTVGTGVTNTTTDPTAVAEGGTAPFLNYYDSQSHRVVVYGDFINNGTVQFTNLAYPIFNALPPTTLGATSGFATVYFMGATDNTLRCNNTTDFYNLILDKGIDKTYALTVYSSAYNNFRLFGANTAGGYGGGANPNLNKALWIRTGTLKLQGLTIIPSLSEGACDSGTGGPNSDFFIPANGALVLDGSEVIVLSTADDYREINIAYGVAGGSGLVNGVNQGFCSSFSILGKLQINNGYFSTRESGGFITWDDASGQFEINGGTVDAKQYRSYGTSGGLASFIQTGGTFLLRGRFQRTPVAYTSVDNLKDFSTTTLNTARLNSGLLGTLGTFNINAAANVFSMSGGTICIYDVCGTAQNEAFEVYSDDANNSVTGGTLKIVPTTGSGTDASEFIIKSTADLGNLVVNRASSSATVDINTYDITILEDLTITSGELDANDLDVSIGGDFTIANGTTYTPGANWTIFNGSGAQSFEMNTGAALNISKFKLDKPAGSVLTLAGTQNTLNVADSMMIVTGTLADGGKTINLAGTIATSSYLYNSGLHTGSGKIVMNDNVPQLITGDGNGVFENIELNNTDGSTAPVSLGANTAINGVLTFSQDNLFDILTYKLNLGEDAAIVNAGTNRFIQSAGNAGDGGLTKTYSASSNTFTFPIGAPSSSHAAAEYTPATLSFSSAPTVYGSITVVPVGYEHPNTTNKNRSLTYFWRTKSEGFTLGTATVNHAYTYSDNDLIENGTTITENEYVAAMYDNASYTWTKYAASDVVDGTNTMGGSGTALATLSFIDGEFTAGDDNATDPFGTPVVYYSRQSGLWSQTSTWSLTDHNTDNEPGNVPGASDIVIIGGQDSVYLATNLTTPNTGVQNAATLKIEEGSALDIGYNYDCNFGIVLSHENGNGNFRITTDFTDRSDFIFPNGDFSDYNVNKGTTEFYSVNPNTNTYFILPSNTDSYGTVILSPLDQSNIVFPNISEVTFYGDLITRGTNWESWFGLTWLTTAGYPAIIPKTVTVKGDLLLERGSLVYIGNNAIQQTVVVEGDVIIFPTSGIDVYAGGGQNSFANTLSIAGDLINNSNNTPAPSGGHAGSNARFYVNANRKIDLVFTGNSNSSITNTGTTPATGSAPNTILGYVSVNKGNSQATTLTVDIGGTLTTGLQDDWLTLENGTFRYEHDGDLRITEDSQFTIPSTAGLYINTPGNTVYLANDNVDNNDVYLNGKLTIINGDVLIGNSANNIDNDIEYSGGGNSEIDIQGGSLTVNGQIRRNPSTSAGILKYNQSGGDVTINGRNALAENAKLEILNAGSEFNMSGIASTLTIVSGAGDGTFGDLYLRPETSTVTGGEIIFNPTSAQNFIFDANVPVWALTISGNANVELLVSPLTVKNDLTIASGGTLDANINFDIPVTINRDFNNSGVYEHRNNITTFNGGTQSILGSAAIDFYDLEVNSLTKLTLNGDANVKNDLILSQGTLECAANTVYIQGDVTNNATYTDNNSGVVLNGTVQQLISGTGTFGTLELDNSQGARLENNITLQKDFILTKGVFDINSKLLSLGENSDIVGSGFSESKMIASDGVYSDVGISKIFTSADNGTTFLYPLGTSAKYTPAVVNITNIDNTGSIRINNINDYHPGVFDENNVLNYFWEIESNGITNFTGSFELNYLDDDVQVTGANTEADYIAAHLLLPGTSWSKAAPGAATDNVDEGNDIITFNFSGTNSLSGEYTAGIDVALPDNVPEFISNQSGDWSNSGIWDQVGGDSYTLSGGPNGFIVTIDSDHTVTIDEDYVSAYRTTINGTLEVVKPYYGHNIGTVSGSGTLYLESGTFPAGRYANFFDCSNNATLEYGGTGTYALIADLYSSLPNLHFTGTGTRTLPSKDLTICNQLLIEGPTLDNSVNNRKLTIQGTMERYSTGTFISGTGVNATISFAGSAAQTVGGILGDFTGANAFNNLEINNSAGLTINTNGDIEVSGDLLLTDGNIVTTSTNILTITNTDINCVIPTGGSAISYVDGPLTKTINQGDNFVFPIGKGTDLGNKLELSSTQSSTIDWTVEFFTPNATYTSLAAPLTYVNSKEYWTVSAPSGSEAYIGVDWDPASDLTPLMTQNGISDMRVAYDNAGTWTEITATASGDNSNGTVTTSNRVSIPVGGSSDFTTACINITKPRARLNPSGAVCGIEGIPVTFTGSALAYDYILTYEKGGVLQAPVTITSADVPYTLPTDATGTTYQLISFTYDEPGNSTTGVVDPSIITTYTVPTIADIGNDGGLNDDDISDCGGTSVANLPGNDPAPYSGLWTIVSGSGGSFVDPTDFDTEFNGTNGTTYELQWTITNGGCSSSDNITVAFPVSNSITLTSAVNTDNQTVCINSAIVDITYSTVGATGATFSGLPTGVTGSWVAGVVTISGTPTVSAGSPYNYTITLTGGCSAPAVTEIGTITVNALPTANDQTPADLCSDVPGENAQVNVDLEAIQTSINGGVPPGITYTWYEDAALTTLVTDANPDLSNVTINVTVNGGAVSATEDFYCVVSNGNCSDVATVTYTIFRVPETGPQYHIENSWGN